MNIRQQPTVVHPDLQLTLIILPQLARHRIFRDHVKEILLKYCGSRLAYHFQAENHTLYRFFEFDIKFGFSDANRCIDRRCFLKLPDCVMRKPASALMTSVPSNTSKSRSLPYITSTLALTDLEIAVRILTVPLPQQTCLLPVSVITTMSCFDKGQ